MGSRSEKSERHSYDDTQAGALWVCCLKCRAEKFFTHWLGHVRRCFGEG